MSSCVCKISFKSVQVCSGCCKMFRGLTFLGTQCRVPGLSCGVVFVILRLAILVELRLVTDRHRPMVKIAANIIFHNKNCSFAQYSLQQHAREESAASNCSGLLLGTPVY